MGQQFVVGHVTAALLNLIGQPIKGAYRTSSIAAISTTETVFATTPEFTPKPSQIYLILSMMSANYGANTAGDRFFHRIRLGSLAGAEQNAATILPQESGASGPFPHLCWSVYASSSTPSAVQFVATLQRSNGDGTISPTTQSIIMPILLGDPADFTIV